MPIRARLFLVLAALVVPVEIIVLRGLTPRWHFVWTVDPFARVIIVANIVSSGLAAAGGAWMILRRPSNRCGPAAVLLGAVFATWFCIALRVSGGWWQFAPQTLPYVLRLLLFSVVLAFPIGKLDRVSRRVLGIYLALGVVAWVVTSTTPQIDDGWPHQPIVVLHSLTVNQLVWGVWWGIGTLAMAAAVLVVARRRTLRFGSRAARVAMPAFWAAAVAAGGDIVLFIFGPIDDLFFHFGNLTWFGVGVELVDYLRWGLAIAILALGATRAWPKERLGAREVELDARAVDQSLSDAVAQALGDPTTRISVREPSGAWLDLDGNPVPEPDPAQAATVLVNGDEPIAALQYGDAVAAHPAVVDAAVTALALQLTSAQQLALTTRRAEELEQLGRDVIAAEDAARRRLESDLHDGAQQELVGLTLQAAMLARRNGDESTRHRADALELAAAVDGARASLIALATGRPPALLVERGLHGALGALVLTAGLSVTARVDPCDGLPDEMQRTVWFVAAEAVTNVLKHADASALRVELHCGDRVTLVVADDGVGGVTRPPVAMALRVAQADGTLTVDSSDRGTTITASFPVASMVAR